MAVVILPQYVELHALILCQEKNAVMEMYVIKIVVAVHAVRMGKIVVAGCVVLAIVAEEYVVKMGKSVVTEYVVLIHAAITKTVVQVIVIADALLVQ